jgi:hypothetical protein
MIDGIALACANVNMNRYIPNFLPSFRRGSYERQLFQRRIDDD